MRYLSSFLRSQAENASDCGIPASCLADIHTVEQAEHQYERHAGRVAVAMQSALHAFDALIRADATVEVYRSWLVVNPDEPRVVEAHRLAIAEAVEGSHWLADCLERHRQALRQAQQDAVQAAADAAGRAA